MGQRWSRNMMRHSLRTNVPPGIRLFGSVL
jgi:hypothetical protein